MQTAKHQREIDKISGNLRQISGLRCPPPSASFPACPGLGPWHFAATSVVEEIWPHSSPYFPYL